MQAVFEENRERMLNIATPEQVELRFETAGIGSRAGAQLIDLLVIAAVDGGVALAGWAAAAAIGPSIPAWAAEYGSAALIIFYAAFAAIYFIIGEFATGGRTIGKRALGIRVIQENGRPLSFLSAVIRNLFRLIDLLPMLYLVGILFSFFHSKNKRIGDWAAGTVVVHEQGVSARRRRRLAKLLQAKQARMPSIELEQWRRERVSAEEWELLSGFAERIGTLSPARANELAEGIVGLLAPKLELAAGWEEARLLPVINSHKQDPLPVLWALAIYSALREDWEVEASPNGEKL